MPKPDSPIRWISFSRVVGSALFGYWIAMGIATHLPFDWMIRPGSETDKMLAEGGDKTVHLIAYAGLAFLFCFWTASRGRFSFAAVKSIALICMLYAIADELLQIPVGRSADIKDGLADWCGTGLGIIGFGALFLLSTPFRSRQNSTDNPGAGPD